MLGAGRVVVPLALLVAAGGVLVTRGEPGESRSDLRLGLGIVLVCAAIVGLLHIGHGSPGGDALEPLQQAGGLLGALFGAPLHALLGGVGAVIVLVAVLVLGALLVFGAGLKQVAAIGFLAVKWLAEHGKGLFTLQPVPLDDAYEPDRPLLYDQVAEELDTSIGPLPEAEIDLVAAEDEVEKVTVFSSTDEVLVGDVEISLSEGDDEDPDDDARRRPSTASCRTSRGSCRRRRSSSAASHARWTRAWSRPGARCSKPRCASSAWTPGSSARPSARPSPATSSRSRRASRSTG